MVCNIVHHTPLLYRLAVALQPVSREQLGFLLWPVIADAAARRNLTVLLNQLRQTLPSALVRTQRDAVWLDPAGVYVDTVAFAEASALAAQPGEIGPRVCWARPRRCGRR